MSSTPIPPTDPVEAKFDTIARGFAFAEAPRVGDDGTVYFSDLTGGGYHLCDPHGRMRSVVPDRIWIGGAVRDESGAILCGGKGGLVSIDPATGERHTLLSELNGAPIIAVNDIEADAGGGIFGGTIDFGAVFERGELPSGGLFFHLAPSGEVRIFRDDMVAPNGIGFSPDNSLLYLAESTVGVWVWRLGEDGMPHSPELFAAIEDCDGLAVDVEGGVWVACWQTAELRRYRPDASLDRRIALPFPSVTSLAFGGADSCDLYVTTGSDESHPDVGGMIRLRSDIAGLRPFWSRIAGSSGHGS